MKLFQNRECHEHNSVEEIQEYVKNHNISILGHDYLGHDFKELMQKDLKKTIELIDTDVNKYLSTRYACYTSIKEMIEDMTDFDTSHLTHEDYKKLKNLNKKYFETNKFKGYDYDEADTIAEFYNILAQKNTVVTYIKECSQSEAIKCHHDKDFDTKYIEDMFFNMGTCYSDEDGCCIYVPWFEEPKEYLKDYYDTFELYKIKTYVTQPIYERS